MHPLPPHQRRRHLRGLWALGTWMAPDLPDPEAWHARAGAAADLVTACCREPGVDQPVALGRPACVWENIP